MSWRITPFGTSSTSPMRSTTRLGAAIRSQKTWTSTELPRAARCVAGIGCIDELGPSLEQSTMVANKERFQQCRTPPRGSGRCNDLRLSATALQALSATVTALLHFRSVPVTPKENKWTKFGMERSQEALPGSILEHCSGATVNDGGNSRACCRR